RSFFSPSAVTCRRTLLFEGGLFDETILSGIEDFDLWQRIAPFARPYFIREPLGYYFDRTGNLSFGGYWNKWKVSVRLAVRYGSRVTPLGMAYHISNITLFHAFHGLRHRLLTQLRYLNRHHPQFDSLHAQCSRPPAP